MDQNEFQKEYSKEKFLDKVKKHAHAIGCPLLCKAFQLYEALKDSDTPAWAKTYIIGVLGYLLAPFDAIPDLTPAVGYSDDLGVLALAVATIISHIKPEHKKTAHESVKKILSDCDCHHEDKEKSSPK